MKARLTEGNTVGFALAGLLAACGPTGKAPAAHGAPDPVVARVNGAPMTRSDVERDLAERKLEATPGTPAFVQGIDEVVDRKLLAGEAVKQGFDKSSEGRRRLQAARERVLGDLLLEDRLRGAATTEAVSGLYQEMVKARPPGAPAETLDEARPRIVRFLTYDRVKDVVLDLRHRAKIEMPAQPRAAK